MLLLGIIAVLISLTSLILVFTVIHINRNRIKEVKSIIKTTVNLLNEASDHCSNIAMVIPSYTNVEQIVSFSHSAFIKNLDAFTNASGNLTYLIELLNEGKKCTQ